MASVNNSFTNRYVMYLCIYLCIFTCILIDPISNEDYIGFETRQNTKKN